MSDQNSDSGPPPAPQTAPETSPETTPGVPASERLMGALGLAFALGIGLIGLDLLTGGALSAALGLAAAPADGEEGSAGDG